MFENDFEFHYTVVYNVASGEFRVEPETNFDWQYSLWNGASWETPIGELADTDSEVLSKLVKLLGVQNV